MSRLHTVTLLRRGTPTLDGYGNDVPGPITEVEVAGCCVWPSTYTGSTSEVVQGRDTVTMGLTVLLPPGTALDAYDAVRLPNYPGTYEVMGQPADWSSPFTGNRAGIQLLIRKTEG